MWLYMLTSPQCQNGLLKKRNEDSVFWSFYWYQSWRLEILATSTTLRSEMRDIFSLIVITRFMI